MISKSGSLVCVGTGMRLAGQLTPIARSHIEQADVVLAAVADPLTRHWLKQMSKRFVCLAQYYGDGSETGKPRNVTYDQMVERIVAEVRQGNQVCAAFYGHPGVFACIAHKAVAEAGREGYPADMLPGISALDCLVADLALDPGEKGLVALEATQFLITKRSVDTSAPLVLWQVGLVGDLTLTRFTTGRAQKALLAEKLCASYHPDHLIVLYEAATQPLESPRIEHLRLDELADAELSPITTLVVPPCMAVEPDQAFLDRLRRLP